jgi:hypothetical protein
MVPFMQDFCTNYPIFAEILHFMQKIHNPFVNKLVVPYVEYITNPLKFTETNEKYGYEVESQTHVRMYTSKANREFIYSLSIYARDMFLAMQYFTQPGKDSVYISYEKMQALCPTVKLSRRRFEDTIRELVKAAVIDYKDRKHDEYWYDPQYFYSGNRLDAFEQAKIKVATKYAEPRRLK